ncbi:histidine kinase, partial [Fusarium albosuccineum]
MTATTSYSLTEIARERETFRLAPSLPARLRPLLNANWSASARYDPALVSNAIPNCPSSLIPSSQLRASSDATLTTFCQVAALRLGCARALISLFDRDCQYVVAEATPCLSLAPNAAVEPGHEGLWLCGTAFARSFGVCESVLVCPTTSSAGVQSMPEGAPVTVIDDLAAHDSFRERPFCHAWPGNRFYAGIPLQTPRGISIGVLCVFDSQPRQGLDRASKQVLRDVAQAIMSYLEGRRISDKHRQADRVTRGIRSFFDNRPSSTRLQDGETLTTESKATTSTVPDNLDRTPLASGDTSLGPTSATPDHGANTKASRYARYPPSVVSPGLSSLNGNIQDRVQRTLALAADLFRNALEVDGLLLLDASMSFSSHQVATTSNSNGHNSVSSSEDEMLHSGCGAGAICPLLTSSVSSEVKRGGDSYFDHANLRERTLKKLLRHYPRGAIWNFDENGAVDSSDVSSEEASSGASTKPSPRVGAADGLGRGEAQKPRGSPGKLRRRRELRRAVFNLLPGARSVAFFPIWDAQKQRWFAGGFAYSERANRILSVKAELSYLRAFGAVIMAEVSAVKARDVERSKLGVLSSVSHEFRSPLHGIILSTELLRDTRLDTFQEDALRSVEVCSRTLLDTIDQVLDWTKINRFASSLENDPNHAAIAVQSRVARSGQNNSEAGMMSITSNVDLATLIEDVVESVHAGHAFQSLSLVRLDSPLNLQRADERDVNIIVDFSPSASWTFHVQVGAIRRIVMNILGNSLKYTTSGFIYIRVEQLRTPESKSCLLRLTIADTGCGISEDYLAHDVFTPFSQENHLESGSGLGLSIVKRIAQGLRGIVEIQSEIGVGTAVRVSLPLEVCEEEQEAGWAATD